ncbi:MAG TPA: sugar phosphate nucleotidyltransferase, partial [Gemmatimonadaceae bacterium]|nr:sugar phosphate nucleotidyltransferase [Gemmatimonadaceae bacterium]
MAAGRWAVVLAGGVGSRFWPLSTPERPKQLLPLVTAQPMLLDTLDRLAPVAPPERTLVLT